MKKKYRSRDFCKAIECPTQKNLEISERNACDEPRDYLDGKSLRQRLVESTKEYCKKCIAWKFHDWLQENGYKIYKEENEEKKEKLHPMDSENLFGD